MNLKNSPEQWQKVKNSWQMADSFLSAIKSRGLVATTLDILDVNKEMGKRVDDATLNIRKLSCFGDGTAKNTACEALRTDSEGNQFCGACGCKSNKLAILTSKNPEDYTKLHYPELECPLQKRGFSNYNEHKDKIFVQIASYRDPELIPTIKDLLNKAAYPNNIDICVAWQHGDDENINEIKNFPNVKILDIKWNESRGLCWARSLIQKEYNNQKYTLQLDSHHRFVENWDMELIEMLKMTNSPKPILTSYAGMYNPQQNKLLNFEPYKMIASHFTDSGTIMFIPHPIENWKSLTAPIPARFVSGHFFFTIGEHCKEYHYDPNLYFAGDEISLSIKSYTLGYDLFHPHKLVIWHEYTREGRAKHWTDFNIENRNKGLVVKQWWEMDLDSKKRLRHLLQEENNNIDLGIYGLGSVRTHKDYELYAGIDFKKRKLHPLTIKGVSPPINDKTDWCNIQENEYKFDLSIPKPDNFKFIYIGIEDKLGNVLYRHDMMDYKEIFNVKFKSVLIPYKWVYWPVDLKGNWSNRIDTLL
jgi:Glycosyltransferase (GlcNAc)